MPKNKVSSTYWVKIYIGGDYDVAKQICRKYVMKGLCINISKVDYIYTMGEESGICVELIQYPIFEKNVFDILEDAMQLANELMEGLYQGSYTVVSPDKTYYHSRKQDIREKNKTNERASIKGQYDEE